ncbi:aminotransferase class V-fold PLP-dependent enzyme [Alloiococcus sp. CFN-8]|uniref:aminotransferase class V-fold PLP-dependent enzyme n=1 Tax=Alloiococcus sp. CFN-8 TaxID=3416081 RepID=UPI003CEB6055
MKIYLDNGATSFPKPPAVTKAMVDFMNNIGSNSGRGSYYSSLETSRRIYNCRELLCKLFNFDKPDHVIFTPNITYSLNILLQGILKPGWHVITSSMEHNSVLRPLIAAKDKLGIELDIVPADDNGLVSTELLKSYINPRTKLIILSHGSNVTGTVQPLKDIGKLCKCNNIYFIIDSAQTAGILPVDFKALGANAIAFTGHKGLMGPQGTGGFLIDDALNNIASSTILGGTGSLSSSTLQPDFLPDKFESGTLNGPGLFGLHAGIDFVMKTGTEAIRHKKSELTNKFINGLKEIDRINLFCHESSVNTGVVSMTFDGREISEIGYLLDTEYNIMTRVGLHCAPLAHKTIGTYPSGTLRFSLGYFNTEKDIELTLSALNNLLRS